MTANKNKKRNYGESWQWYQNFLSAWHNNTLTESDKVYIMVKAMAYNMCWSFKRLDEVDDLIQEVLTALSKGQYQKGASLKTYTRTIMKHQVTQWWKKNGKGMVNQFDDTTLRAVDKQAFIAAEVKRRILKDDDLRIELLSKVPNLMEVIVKVMSEYHYENNKIPSIRKIVGIINESDPEHKVTRHAVSTALKRLKNSLRR